jgi:predicted RNase H-like HicB family nuclease
VATGSSRKAAEKNIKEAISWHVKGLKEDGLIPLKPTASTEYIEVE